MRMHIRSSGPLLMIVLFALAATLTAGCQAIGVFANAMPKPDLPARYDLSNQDVAVMVWTDRATRMDWPNVQINIASGVQQRLIEAAKEPKIEVLQGTEFPMSAETVRRWQLDHPGFDAAPVTDIATQFDVTRLIYIELDELSTRSSQAFELYRGTARVNIKVVEVADGVGRIGYEENGIAVVFPKRSTPEGRPGIGDVPIYSGTVQALADEIASRFTPTPQD